MGYDGSALNSIRPVLNAVAFGCKEDGTTDNSVAIARALAATAGTGRSVYFPRRTGLGYGFGSPIYISGDNGMAGAGLIGDCTASDTGGGGSGATNLACLFALTGGGSQFASNSGTGGALALYSATGSSAVVASVSASNYVTITGLTGLVYGGFGSITFSGFTHPANDGPFPLSFDTGHLNTPALMAAGTVIIKNISGAAVPGDTGGTWILLGSTCQNNGTTCFVLANIPNAAIAKLSVGDRCNVTNVSIATNTGSFPVLSFVPGGSVGNVYLLYSAGVSPSMAPNGFSGPDTGGSGGVNWSFTKPLVKCFARGATIRGLYFVGSGTKGGDNINVTNDVGGTSLTTNVRIEDIFYQNCVYGIVIGDAGGQQVAAPNVDNGRILRCYATNCSDSSVYFAGRSGQAKTWVIAENNFTVFRYGIYQTTGSFKSRDNGFTLTTGAVSAIAISQGTDVFTLEGDNVECNATPGCYLLSPYTGFAINVKVDTLRFDATSLLFGGVIAWGAGSGLKVLNTNCSYQNGNPMPLVALHGLGVQDSTIGMPQCELESSSMGGLGPFVVQPLVSQVPNSIPGGLYKVRTGCTATNSGAFAYFPEGTFQVNAENTSFTIPIRSEHIVNLAMTTGQMATLASGTNVAIPYQGYTCLEHHGDPGGAFSLDGMVAPFQTPEGTPSEARIEMAFFAPATPRAVTVNHLAAGASPGRRFVTKTAAAITVTPAGGGLFLVRARYSPFADPVALAGAATIGAGHASTAISFSSAQTLAQGTWITIAGVFYRLALPVVAALSGTVTKPYAGSTASGIAANVCNGAYVVTEAA